MGKYPKLPTTTEEERKRAREFYRSVSRYQAFIGCVLVLGVVVIIFLLVFVVTPFR